ncbi:hypothetical protein HC761_02395 [bacterium]|nr:hypothetical protein [bacterium]
MVLECARALADAEADAMATSAIYKAKLDEVHAQHEKEMREGIARVELQRKVMLALIEAMPYVFGGDTKSMKLDQLNFGIKQSPREVKLPDDIVQRLEQAPEFFFCLKHEVTAKKSVLNGLSDEVLQLFGCEIVPPCDRAFVTSKNSLGMPR